MNSDNSSMAYELGPYVARSSGTSASLGYSGVFYFVQSKGEATQANTFRIINCKKEVFVKKRLI